MVEVSPNVSTPLCTRIELFLLMQMQSVSRRRYRPRPPDPCAFADFIIAAKRGLRIPELNADVLLNGGNAESMRVTVSCAPSVQREDRFLFPGHERRSIA